MIRIKYFIISVLRSIESLFITVKLTTGLKTTLVIWVPVYVGDSCSERPLDPQDILVLLHEEHDDNPDAVDHEEREHHLIPQFQQLLLYIVCLLLCLLLLWHQVHINDLGGNSIKNI